MIVDLVCAAFVLLLGYAGYRSGFVVQLANLAALVAAFVVARQVAPPVGKLIAGAVDTSVFVAEAGAFAATFFLVTFAINLLVGAAVQKLRRSGTFSYFDRGLGGILGGVKGAALSFIVVSLLVALGPSLGESVPGFPSDFRGSVVGREALRHDFLQRQVFPRARALGRIVSVLRDKRTFLAALADPRWKLVIEHPRASFLREPLIQEAIMEGEWSVLVRDGRVFALLEDIDVVHTLNAIETDSEADLPAEAPPPTPNVPPLP